MSCQRISSKLERSSIYLKYVSKFQVEIQDNSYIFWTKSQKFLTQCVQSTVHHAATQRRHYAHLLCYKYHRSQKKGSLHQMHIVTSVAKNQFQKICFFFRPTQSFSKCACTCQQTYHHDDSLSETEFHHASDTLKIHNWMLYGTSSNSNEIVLVKVHRHKLFSTICSNKISSQ